jgi:tetratricopeptide (TPR) repeat protein
MVKQTPVDFRNLVAAAEASYAAGRFAEADQAFRAALILSPGHAAITHNLGVVAAARGRPEAALGFFDEAIATDSDYGAAHYNRAVALMALHRPQDAIWSFSRACALEPAHYDAHRALGFLWLSEGGHGRALDHFARTFELRRGDDRTTVAAKSLTYATPDKLRHDAEQFRYLSQHLRDGQRFEMLARNYEAVADEFGEEAVSLSDQQIDMLGEDYNTAVHVRDAPELADGAVSEALDGAALTRKFERQGGIVYFDDLLTPAALHSLKRYLLESTIWHDFSHIGGFVASYLEDGLACPLLLQIADEVRHRFPELLSAHPLTQAWAFKSLRTDAAIDAHADDAAISLNFWLTPTGANQNPDRGGMVVCRAPPPADWEMTDYEADHGRAVTFLEQNAASNLKVPYRENRAVLFKSRLLHYSDAPKFASGYENHRINVTMLFGGQDG